MGLDFASEDLWGRLLRELDDQRQLVVLDEVQQFLFGDVPLKVVAAFVELWMQRGTL